jgi:hypothetical protein
MQLPRGQNWATTIFGHFSRSSVRRLDCFTLRMELCKRVVYVLKSEIDPKRYYTGLRPTLPPDLTPTMQDGARTRRRVSRGSSTSSWSLPTSAAPWRLRNTSNLVRASPRVPDPESSFAASRAAHPGKAVMERANSVRKNQ